VPPLYATDNWLTPVNYYEGTLQFRVEIFSIPVNQPGMRMNFCYWQYRTGDPFQYETCTIHNVPGAAGNVITWSDKLTTMWTLDKKPLDWTKPRTRSGIVIKNASGTPVSAKKGWNWGCGSNPNCTPRPDDWYPMNIRFTVVAVEKGKTFSGWSNYFP